MGFICSILYNSNIINFYKLSIFLETSTITTRRVLNYQLILFKVWTGRHLKCFTQVYFILVCKYIQQLRYRRLHVDSGLIAHDEMKNLAGSLSSIDYSRTFRRNNLRYKLNNNVN